MKIIKAIILSAVVALFVGSIQAKEKDLTITVDPTTENPHLKYKAINITNIGANDVTIQRIQVALDEKAQKLVHYCGASDSSLRCGLPNNSSVCQGGLILRPQTSCQIWLEAASIGKLNIGGAFNIMVKTPSKNYAKKFSLTFEQDLFIGGRFENKPEKPFGVIKWDGANWVSFPELDIGAYDDSVMSLALLDNYLFAGGSFNSRVARYNLDNPNAANNNWELFPGLSDAAETLMSFDHKLYAGGEFSGAYRLNNSTKWEQVGNFTKGVNQYMVSAGQLYAAGEFDQKVIKLNPDKNSWSQVCADLPQDVNNKILVNHDNDLYSGGMMNAYKMYRCALSSTKTWMGIDARDPYHEIILTAASLNHQLFYGSFSGLYRLDGTYFKPIISVGTISALLVVGDSLYVAGNYQTEDNKLEFLTKYSYGDFTQIAPKTWEKINLTINTLLAVPTWNIQ